MSTLNASLILFAILYATVILHEFGHFIVCRAFGIKVNAFRVGLGPSLPVGKNKETVFMLGLIPAGGACVIDDNSFASAKPKERLCTLLAGVAMNFLVALIFLFISGIMTGEGFFETAGVFVSSIQSIFMSLGSATAQSVDMTTSGIGESSEIISSAVSAASSKADIALIIFKLIYVVNIALGVVNALPIPGLDGGQAVFAFLDMIGIKIEKKMIDKMNTACLYVLLGLSSYIILKDIVVMFI